MFKNSRLFSGLAWSLFYLLVFVLLLQHSFSYLDPDFGWHLRMGQDVALTGKVASLNYSNYTLLGERWVDHEWLSNLTIYYIYTDFGYITLNIIFGLLPILTLIIVNYLLRKVYKVDTRKRLWSLMLFEILAIVAVTPHLGVRIQEITLLFLAILLLLIYKYNRRPNYLVLSVLPPLVYLWSNLHGGFLLGLAIMFMFPVVKMAELILSRFWPWKYISFKQTLKTRQIFLFFLAAGASFLLTLLTPYRLELYSFLFGYSNTFYLDHIVEWLPQWSFPYQYWQFTYISVLALALGFYLRDVFVKRTKQIRLWEIGLCLVFLLMAIKSRRHFPLLFVASFPWLFWYLSDFLSFVPKDKPVKKEAKNSLLNYGLRLFIVLVFLVVSFDLFLAIRFTSKPFTAFCEDKYVASRHQTLYPCRAVDYLKANKSLANERLFNHFGWGGYLIWGYPSAQLFIDGRMPQAAYKGRTILEEYFDFLRDGKAAAKLKEYDISLVLLENKKGPVKLSWWEKKIFLINEEEINRPSSYLEDYLSSSTDWQLLYHDSISSIYRRNSADRLAGTD